MIPLIYVLLVSSLLFAIGAMGMMTKRNAVRVLMCIEIMVNAANINLVAFSVYRQSFDPSGQVFAVFSIAVTAAEVAVGLAIYILVTRTHRTIELQKINLMRW
ncbi:MAG: NADH-quinone oxidoreductase subunit NuoK [Candidatus Hydrothermarchaeaceae archaeon]